jgi:hypothetical protein
LRAAADSYRSVPNFDVDLDIDYWHGSKENNENGRMSKVVTRKEIDKARFNSQHEDLHVG